MKKTLAFMVMALALLLTQCRKPSITFPTPSVTTTVSMTITAGPGSKTDITAEEGTITWSEDDKIYVGDGNKYVGYLTLKSGEGGNATGTFTGYVTASTGTNKTFYFYYLGNAKDYDAEIKDKQNLKAVVDFSSQDIHADGSGNLTNASGQHVGYGKAEHVTVEKDKTITVPQPVSMKSMVAIAYFRFKDGESATSYTGAITLRGDNIYNEMTVFFNQSYFDFRGEKGDISLAGGHCERYAMLVPPENVASETLNFGGVATGSTTFENGIEANKFYRIDGDKPIEVTLTFETVNMDLPSPYDKLEWSKYNLGVNPLDLDEYKDWFGDYYAWGETAPYYQNGSWCEHPSHNATITFNASVGYGWRNYLDGNSSSWVEKLDWKPYGEGTTLTSEHDAATVAWGPDWRMPTEKEWQKLCDGTNKEFVESYNGVNVKGWLFKSKTDRSKELFIPAAGKYDGAYRSDLNIECYCWSSKLNTDDHGTAWALTYEENTELKLDCWNRTKGYPVRPVREAR